MLLVDYVCKPLQGWFILTLSPTLVLIKLNWLHWVCMKLGWQLVMQITPLVRQRLVNLSNAVWKYPSVVLFKSWAIPGRVLLPLVFTNSGARYVSSLPCPNRLKTGLSPLNPKPGGCHYVVDIL